MLTTHASEVMLLAGYPYYPDISSLIIWYVLLPNFRDFIVDFYFPLGVIESNFRLRSIEDKSLFQEKMVLLLGMQNLTGCSLYYIILAGRLVCNPRYTYRWQRRDSALFEISLITTVKNWARFQAGKPPSSWTTCKAL